MVAIDTAPVPPSRKIFLIPIPVSLLIGGACAVIVLGAMAVRGFGENGLRLGSEFGWRFACFAFFAAIVAGPVRRLLPFGLLRPLGALQRQLLWGFCASYAVFLASLLVPDLMGSDIGGFGMTLAVLFGGLVTGAIAFVAGRRSEDMLGHGVRRAFLTIGLSFFWLAYALTGLAHISGPHRPDSFYGISLGLMIGALLLRFLDRFVSRLKGTPDSALEPV